MARLDWTYYFRQANKLDGSPPPAVADVWSSAVRLLFPPLCTLCEADLSEQHEGPLFCRDCLVEFESQEYLACSVCAFPLPGGATARSLCFYCQRRKYQFSHTVCLGVYRGRIREAVLKMKRLQHESLLLAAGQVLAARLDCHFRGDSAPRLVVPIPMHWSRRLRRGSNGAEVLAERLAERLSVRLGRGALRCMRKVSKQGTLLPSARFSNVRDAFAVSSAYDIKGFHILLVDDVMTTGATANEAARVLRRAGAARVSVAVIARGVGGDFVVVPRPREDRP